MASLRPWTRNSLSTPRKRRFAVTTGQSTNQRGHIVVDRLAAELGALHWAPLPLVLATQRRHMSPQTGARHG